MIDITFEFQNLLNIFASNWKLPLMSEFNGCPSHLYEEFTNLYK